MFLIVSFNVNESGCTFSPSDNIRNDFEKMKSEVGKMSDKLDALMERQEETKDQGEFYIK